MSLAKRLAKAQEEAESILAMARQRREDDDRACILQFSERFRDPLSERERQIVAAMHNALWLSDAKRLYFSLHPSKPEERLGDREALLEDDAFNQEDDEFNAIMAERHPTPPLPLDATALEPGTESKILAMAARYARGEHLYHPDDIGRDFDDRLSRGVERGPNGRAREVGLRLTKGDAA